MRESLKTKGHFTNTGIATSSFALVIGLRILTAAGEISSVFDQGFDGWVPVSLEASGTSDWTWQSEGGNGGGFVRFRDNLNAPLFNYLASPSIFNGDWSTYEGTGEFRYDFRLTGDSSGIRSPLVLVHGPFGEVMSFQSLRTGVFEEGWETVSAPLIESAWQIHRGSWREILSDVSRVDIYPLYNGRDYGRLLDVDNVMLVPEPNGWALLGIGLGIFLGYRRVGKGVTRPPKTANP